MFLNFCGNPDCTRYMTNPYLYLLKIVEQTIFSRFMHGSMNGYLWVFKIVFLIFTHFADIPLPQCLTSNISQSTKCKFKKQVIVGACMCTRDNTLAKACGLSSIHTHRPDNEFLLYYTDTKFKLSLFGPRREKTCLRGFQQSDIQASLLSYRD